jgi:Ricin-type beta-trefoil lectin domain-like
MTYQVSSLDLTASHQTSQACVSRPLGTRLRVALIALALLGVGQVARADNCYVLTNRTSSTQTWRFSYDGNVPFGSPISIAMIPSGRYPVDGPWCFHTPDGIYVRVSLDNGGLTTSWTGQLILGNGPLAYPSGTYSLNSSVNSSVPEPPNPDPSNSRGRPDPPRHRKLTDADCQTSDVVDDGVYTLENSGGIHGAACLGFETNDASKVMLAGCDTHQQRVFTFGRRQDGCYFVRNGDVHGPRAGRCLDSDATRNNDGILALACNDTEYQRWRLFKLANGTYNLINKASGQCLDRDSNHPNAGDEAHQYDCNGTDLQGWSLHYVRKQ